MFTLKNILRLIGHNLLISLVAISVTVTLIAFISNKIEILTDSTFLNHRLAAELENRIELFEVLKDDAKIIGSNDLVIDAAFVPSDDISAFTDRFDALAKDEALMQKYHFETPAGSAISAGFPISSISYTNNLSTDVSHFSDYLKGFEELPYFIKIEGFSIASQDKLGWVGTSTISFRATLYTKETK